MFRILNEFFNKKNECPKTKNNKEIHHHSDYIKIQFDGGEMRKKFKMWFKFNSTCNRE